MLLIMDTDVLTAAMRSRTGAAAECVRWILRGQARIALSVAMALEYEAVVTRAEHLTAGGMTANNALTIVDALVSLAQPVQPHFRWRPQLRDPNDEMILECAVNAGADAIITFNKRDFANAVDRFGITLFRPIEILTLMRNPS